jgi:hypothetical protein
MNGEAGSFLWGGVARQSEAMLRGPDEVSCARATVLY